MANAGVVGMSEVIVPSSAPAGTSLAGTPAMWSFVWVGFAVLILISIHISVAGRG